MRVREGAQGKEQQSCKRKAGGGGAERERGVDRGQRERGGRAQAGVTRPPKKTNKCAFRNPKMTHQLGMREQSETWRSSRAGVLRAASAEAMQSSAASAKRAAARAMVVVGFFWR